MTDSRIADPAGRDFDPHSALYRDHSHELFAEMRERCPVVHSEKSGGFWAVSRYRDVVDAARNDDLFASRMVPGTPFDGVLIQNPDPPSGMMETDPPRFLPIRRATNPYFAPPAVERMRSEILDYTTWCIDQFAERGSADLIEELASTVPALLTMRLLGLPLRRWREFSDALHSGGHTRPDEPGIEVRNSYHDWARDEIRAAVHERLEHPGDDLLSLWATLEVDGERMPIDEVVGNGFLLLAGGLDTTTGLLGHTFMHLHRDRAARAWLSEDDSRLAMACEEYLRYYTPVQGLARTVTEPCEFAGQSLAQHDRMWLLWASANLDESEFPDAEQLVLDRSPNRHVAFGVGIHRCIGSGAARAMWQIIVSEVLKRIPDYVVDEEHAEQYVNTAVVNGWIHLPVTFTPTSRVGIAIEGLEDGTSG